MDFVVHPSSSMNTAGGPNITTNRPRYASAPPLSSVDTAELNLLVNDGIWSHISDGGRRLRLKSKEIVSIYVPIQWQPLVMEGFELICDHMQKHFSTFRRQVTTNSRGISSQTTPASSYFENGDEPTAAAPNRPFSYRTPSLASSFENKAARLVLTLTLGSLTFYIVYGFLFESLLEFFLPFYAAFNCSYWFLLWYRRRRRRPHRRRHRIDVNDGDFDSNYRRNINQHQRDHNDDEYTRDSANRSSGVIEEEEDDFKQFQKLICFFSCLDLFLLFVRSTLDSHIVRATVLHGLPVILLLFAQKIFSWFNDADTLRTVNCDDDDDSDSDDSGDGVRRSDDDNSFNLSTLNAYFVLIYVVRLFSCQGLTLVPFCLRPFLGYISTYLAFVGVEKRSQSVALSSATGFKSDFSTSYLAGVGGNKVSFCSNCVGGVGRSSTGVGASGLFGSSNIGSSNINQIAFNMPATGRPSIKIQHSADGGEPSSFQQKPGMGRASRRISLPAGSLMPIKTQVS